MPVVGGTTEFPVLRNPGGERLGDLDPRRLIEACKTHGAVVAFGYRATIPEFEAFTDHLCTDWQDYRGGAHKKVVLNPESDSTIYSTNFYLGSEEQYTFPLPLHSDMSYMKNRPAIICFYAVQPAVAGGETTVVDGVVFRDAMRESTRRFFEEHQILYVRTTAPQHRRLKFFTDEFAVAEAFCRDNDMTLEEDAAGNWITRYVACAFRTSAFGGHRVYSNSILPVLWQMEHGMPGSIVCMADGSPIPPAIVAELRELEQRLPARIQWEQPGDIGMMDNTRVIHGREPFEDLGRNIAQRLGRAVNW